MATDIGPKRTSQNGSNSGGDDGIWKYDGPTMLYRALLDEYVAIGIFDDDDLAEVKVHYNSRKAALFVIRYEVARELPLADQRAKQFELRQMARFEALEKVREVHHRKTASAPMTALCLSGGGIRSATFGLGVIQSLAKAGLLDKFHYLSSVSGGGYIASWLSAWIHRSDLDSVQQKLRGEGLDAGTVEAPEITYLRRFSNFLNPRTGLFSTDTWTLIAVYVRNVLLNWTVLIPLIAAALLLPKLFVSILRPPARIALMPPDDYFNLAVGLIIAVGVIGVAFTNMMRPSLKRHSWFKQEFGTDDIGSIIEENKVALFCAFPVTIFAIGTAVLWSWTDVLTKTLSDFVLFGITLFVGGFLLGRLFMFCVDVWHWLWPKPVPAERESSRYGILEFIFSAVSGAVGGLLLYLFLVKLLPATTDNDILWLWKPHFIAAFGVPIILTVFLLSASLFTGLAVKFTDDDDREWVTRFGAILMKLIVGWSVIGAAVIFGPRLFDTGRFGTDSWDSIVKFGGSAIAVISGLFSVVSGFSGSTSASDDAPAKDRSGLILTIASSIAAPIFVLFLIVMISFGTSALIEYAINGSEVDRRLASLFGYSGFLGTDRLQVVMFVAFASICAVMGSFVNINKFSFHATYRERLIRAYLGASNYPDRMLQANSFTGLNTENDNVEMKDLSSKPFHVVNMTLNMVKANNLAWQNRKAQSFTSTKLHTGSSQMGASGNYRPSAEYAHNTQNDKSITLGTALAISGAAASPNMGYFTQSTAVSFLMVLFNVRLGWWLGNPGRRGKYTWKLAAPRWSPRTFLSEAFALTDDTRPYVYLADGGQFENLGLYEMVLRRCRMIVVCDAGADPTYGFYDLGAAIHKIRVDMGIPIEFEHQKTPAEGRYGAIAKIRYTEVDGKDSNDGILLYLKPTLNGSEPIDIQHYQSENTDFPHETTADQFYSESQFESYRSLGFNMMESLRRGGAAAGSIGELIKNATLNIR